MDKNYVPRDKDDYYAVNLYRRRYAALKEDGYMVMKKYSADEETEPVRSMPLDKNEVEAIQNYR